LSCLVYFISALAKNILGQRTLECGGCDSSHLTIADFRFGRIEKECVTEGI